MYVALVVYKHFINNHIYWLFLTFLTFHVTINNLTEKKSMGKIHFLNEMMKYFRSLLSQVLSYRFKIFNMEKATYYFGG